ncbi:hypothetical protein [Flexivirga meconopsidis]|uniref:hypothetical protein n=1 Tax=Flexivirga meconopsidis TaxID=2977121 RepID=UPI00224052D1|nr:hypothetical protein [Flexivirga meconopsidis]
MRPPSWSSWQPPTAPAAPSRVTLAPARVTWDPDGGFYRYAQSLAAANDCTVEEFMGARFTATQWRTGRPDVLARLTARSGTPVEQLWEHSPARYHPLLRRHWLIGHLDPGGPDSVLILDLLPDDDPRTPTIRADVTTGQWTAPDLRSLLDLATRVIPHLSDTWPLGHHDGDHRAEAVRDPTRTLPWAQWSVTVRTYALLWLWDADTVDLHATGRWLTAANSLDSTTPSLGTALRTAALTNTEPAFAAGVVAIGEPVTGPFSVPSLTHMDDDVLRVLHAADLALHTNRIYESARVQESAMLATEESLQPPERAGPRRRKVSWDEPHWPRHVTDSARLLTTPAGRSFLAEVRDRIHQDPAPLDRDVAATWWSAHAARATRYLATAMPNRLKYGLYVADAFDLIWVDLTGHLPITLRARIQLDRLVAASRRLDPETLLSVRHQILEWTGTTSLDQTARQHETVVPAGEELA